MTKQKTYYEWRCENYTSNGQSYTDASDNLIYCVGGELEDYGSENREDLEPFWEICLNKRVFDVEDGDILEEDYWYLELVDQKFQFTEDDDPPKRFIKQVEKLNEWLKTAAA